MNSLIGCGLAGLAVLIGLNVLARAIPWAWHRWQAARAAKPASSDLLPHDAAVAWVQQIVTAAGAQADAAFLVKHLQLGSTAAAVMADRIRELESRLPQSDPDRDPPATLLIRPAPAPAPAAEAA